MSGNRIYEVSVGHVRNDVVRHDIRHRTYQWFVDLDDLPRLPRGLGWLARFQSRDHVGDPALTLRQNVDAYLAENGIDLLGGRVTMLTNARSAGYVFNPLSVYWCHDPAGALVCVVAEVHNTYGQRHRYLLFPDDAGRAETEKQFYVSPFYPVDGFYRMSVPEPAEQLAVTITLHREGQRPFTASVRGTARPATTAAALRVAVRHPLETWLVRALITVHGIRLWRKGLPVQPRPNSEDNMKRTVADRLAALIKRCVGIDLPVRLRAWDGSEAGPADGPVLVIKSRRALRRLLWAPGELGLARAYVTGDIDVEGDLAAGFRQAWSVARQRPETGIKLGPGDLARAALAAARLGAIGLPPKAPATEAKLSGGLHSRLRDRKAISHHYDLSNDFYQLLLDPNMAYSSAYYEYPGQSLVEAQDAKLDLICRKLDLKPGMRLLDIGCGWGSLIVYAAKHYGVSAVGITLSAQQRDHIGKRIADEGLQDLVSVRLQDYREFGELVRSGAEAPFDAVSSIEMGEHVGEEQYPTYTGIMFDALKPTGRLLLQQMSRRMDSAPGGGAFIESYIAPDMHMRPLWHTVELVQNAGFEVRDVEAMREHYVTTVEDWIATFESNYAKVVAMVGEETARVWRLYLVGGALSFEEGRMGVDQFLAVKPTSVGESAMPPMRPWARPAAQ
ncbi:DUF1365 family protein [Jatrophihabitans sp.]|uniref:DUF1365 family protein n=1 Tax=Jatrophihabitans sp. TaxID=1932789 RepID=UPI0030C7277A|nr:cyclopropane-fatty-acyl-phospholipid synthase [Jatrophihabitans sp.]